MLTARHPIAADCVAWGREVRSVLNENQLTLYGQILATLMLFSLAWTGRANADTAVWVIGAIWTVRIPELAEAWLRVREDRFQREADSVNREATERVREQGRE